MNSPLSFRIRAADRRSGACSPESITTKGAEARRLVVMDSGLAPEPVIGPAQAGRTRWARPGMTELI